MIKRHLEDILTAIVTGATTARANGFKTVAQKIRRDAWGFCNKERFQAAIYSHLAGLDRFPAPTRN